MAHLRLWDLLFGRFECHWKALKFALEVFYLSQKVIGAIVDTPLELVRWNDAAGTGTIDE